MDSLRSFRMGMSKSYQSLDTIGNDNDNNFICVNSNINTDPMGSECPEIDNFRREKNKIKPFHALKSAMSKVSRHRYKLKNSKSSAVLNELGSEWRIQEERINANQILGKIRNTQYTKMPSTMIVPAEQASLLGNFPPEGLDDVELRNVQLSLSHGKCLSDDGSCGQKETVETQHGPITVSVVGDRSKPVILTYHDLGLNHVTNYQAFMLYPEMKQLVKSFCLIHVNAPGQEDNALTLPEGYVYPTMEELAETIGSVKSHFDLKAFIGFGIGLGANVLSRYAVKYPNDVDALVLINCSSTQAGWVEWGYQKVNIRHLKGGSMTNGTVDYLLWHHFGRVESCNQDLVTVYRQHFEKSLNATNLGLLVDSYIRRTDLGIVREMDPNKKKDVQMLRCPTLNVTSNFSPHIEDTVTFNAKLDPSISTWMKIQDCGLVIDEYPSKIVEAFRLFLQGQGYVINLRTMGSRQSSQSTLPSSHSNGSLTASDMRITENPLQNSIV